MISLAKFNALILKFAVIIYTLYPDEQIFLQLSGMYKIVRKNVES